MNPESLKFSDCLDYASGTATRNGASVDMAGYEWVMFIYKFATIAASAVTSIKVQQSSDDAAADDFSDVEGTAQTVAADDDNQNFIVTIKRPSKRYLRPVVVKDATNAAAELVIAVRGGGGGANLASVTDEITLESFVAPSEGTA